MGLPACADDRPSSSRDELDLTRWESHGSRQGAVWGMLWVVWEMVWDTHESHVGLKFVTDGTFTVIFMDV